MKRIKILYSGETTGASSGFGTYGYNILSRLVKNPKFHIAEFASFGTINDGKYSKARWRYYPNSVEEGHPEYQLFKSNPQNNFGAWRYEKVLLDFKPDIVFTIRDPWMMEHEHKSSLRPFYHLSIMPTVDSAPQQHSWIDMFSTADSVFTYSDWAIPVLKEQSGNKIQPICSPYPGIEFDCFYPSVNKKDSKRKYGLPENSFIIGTVMRNQKRKLLEDLFHAFNIYLEKYGETEQGKKTYLLVHTSYPDFAGWNIPQLLKKYGISNKVYFTYYCSQAKQVLIKKFSGTKSFSPFTNHLTAIFPSVGIGVSRKQLGDIYRCMDLYVQYAICFAKNQEVKTKRGWIPIQNVKPGDYCWTKESRWREVQNVWENLPKSHNKKMMKISLTGTYETIEATENHPFPAYTSLEIPHSKNSSVRKQFKKLHIDNKIIPNPDRYEINDLKIGDLLLYPIDDTITDVEKIDLSKYADNNDVIDNDIIYVKNGKSYNKYINVDNDFCKFLGLYAGDGTTNKSYVSTIACNKKDLKNINFARAIFKKLPINNTIYEQRRENRNCVNIGVCSSIHHRFFIKEFKKQHLKQLPNWTEHLPLEKQRNIIVGLFMADGHYNVSKNQSEFSTISSHLANQLKELLNRLRLPYGCSKEHRKDRRVSYRFSISGNILNDKFPNVSQHKSKNYYYQNWKLIQIKNIEEIEYNDKVYNLDIKEDQTFAVRGSCAYNCEGL